MSKKKKKKKIPELLRDQRRGTFLTDKELNKEGFAIQGGKFRVRSRHEPIKITNPKAQGRARATYGPDSGEYTKTVFQNTLNTKRGRHMHKEERFARGGYLIPRDREHYEKRREKTKKAGKARRKKRKPRGYPSKS